MDSIANMTQKIWNRDFLLLTLSNFLLSITYYSLISTLPLFMADELHAEKSAIGAVLAAFTIAAVTVRPITGFALDKFGRKTIFLSALLLYTALFAGYLITLTLLLITIVRFVQGLGWGVGTIASSTIAVDSIPPEKRGEGLGYYSLSTTLGMSVGPLIGLFICHHWNYYTLFVIMLVSSMLSFACGYFLKLPSKALISPKIDLRFQNLFEIRAILPSLNLMVIMMAYGGMLSFVALYGKEMGIGNTSLFFFILSCGIAFSRLTAGKVFDRKGPGRILSLGLTLNILGFTVLALFRNPAGYFASAIIIGFGNGVVFPVFQTMVNNLASPGHRGAANSTLFTALDIGMGIGMVMMGIISQQFSMSVAFLCCAVICLCGLFLFRRYVLDYYSREVSYSRLSNN